MSDLTERLCRPGYDLQKEQAIQEAIIEIRKLHAKIEQMERQEIGFRERCTPSSPTGYSNRFPLYALPGAQGESE